MIRISGGALAGRVLPGAVPAGVRPTSGRVREALYSMLGQDLSGWSMLDLFGGTGLMALEAASRGAAPVTVVERNPRAVAVIRRNADALGVALRVRQGDAARCPLDPADLVFLDPPYAEAIGPWLARAAGVTRRVLVAEVRSGAAPEPVAGFTLDLARDYGDTALRIYLRDPDGAGRSPEARNRR